MKRLVELTIEDISTKGDGIGSIDSQIFRVKGALPGDVVRAKIKRRRKGFVEAETVTILKEGIPRIEPRCGHFHECGGCKWQDIEYKEQLKLKSRVVKNALKRAGFDGLDVAEPIGSKNIFFYRNKMEFSFGSDKENRPVLGLHVQGRYDLVFNLDKCYLQSEESNSIVEDIRNFVESKKLSIYDLKSHEGLLRFVTIREGKGSGEVMVNLVTSDEEFKDKEDLARYITKRHDVKSLLWNVNPEKSQIAVGLREEILDGRGYIVENIGGLSFQISANSFFQTNSFQSEELYDIVLEFADLKGDEDVLDLYCGTGAISLFLSRKAKSVVGVELVESAVEDASQNATQNEISNCEFIYGDVKEILPRFLQTGEFFDVAVVDPPREGMHKKACRALSRLSPARIVCVSCNPESLAADLRILSFSGYKVEVLQPVDMFPHTPHIEVVAKLVRV